MSRFVGARARVLFSLAALLCAAPAMAASSGEPEVTVANANEAKALFDAWKSHDTPVAAPPVVSVPLDRPVDSFRYTSPFGERVDPFRGVSAFHAGVDLAAPVGTPVKASGDARVSRAGKATGYGNLVVLDHGAGIETRYGHLSRILVKEGQRIRRGEVIGLVGSTGRSTGSHLHYEVRLAEQAVNPLPFMAPGDERLALNQAVGPTAGSATAMGGPRTETK